MKVFIGHLAELVEESACKPLLYLLHASGLNPASPALK